MGSGQSKTIRLEPEAKDMLVRQAARNRTETYVSILLKVLTSSFFVTAIPLCSFSWGRQ